MQKTALCGGVAIVINEIMVPDSTKDVIYKVIPIQRNNSEFIICRKNVLRQNVYVFFPGYQMVMINQSKVKSIITN